jgi:hypothetical protein
MATMSSDKGLKSESQKYSWMIEARIEDGSIHCIDKGNAHSLHQACWASEFAANNAQRLYPEITIVQIAIQISNN